MPRDITNIHDKFIKQILSNKELAVEFLKQYLPEALTSILDFETLTQQDTSYITDRLKTSYSDLIWGVQIKGQRKPANQPAAGTQKQCSSPYHLPVTGIPGTGLSETAPGKEKTRAHSTHTLLSRETELEIQVAGKVLHGLP